MRQQTETGRSLELRDYVAEAKIVLAMLASSVLRCAARLPSAARAGAATLQRARGLCDGVDVDQVCRVFSCKVADDASAHRMDMAFEDFLDRAGVVEGVCGASRLVCKEFWDYKLILKFEDAESLTGYMEGHHAALSDEFLPSIKALAVGGAVKEQNFVYDDVE